MIRNANTCTSGECGGECWRCIAKENAAERDRWKALALKMFDAGVCSGHFGPWHETWTDEDRDMLWPEST